MLAFPLTGSPAPAIMAMMIRFLFALGMIAWAVPTVAQSKLSPFDPARIEFATPTTQSAGCIDNLKDGICALHAVIACNIPARRPKCDGLTQRHTVPNTNPGYRPTTRVEYRIIAAGIVTRDAVREFDRLTNRERFVPLSGLAFVRPGILQARVIQRSCSHSVETCEGEKWLDSTYVLKRDKGRWAYDSSSLFIPDEWLAGPVNDP